MKVLLLQTIALANIRAIIDLLDKQIRINSGFQQSIEDRHELLKDVQKDLAELCKRVKTLSKPVKKEVL